MSKTVCVTGATGFVAGHIIHQLLEKGYHVNATVRDVNKTERLTALQALPNADTHLTFFSANLLEPKSFDKAIEGCSIVIHIAAVVNLGTPKDPQTEIVDPSVNGTLNVLRSCQKYRKTVNQVILFSSIAAANRGCDGKQPYNEFDWNDRATILTAPYSLSKTLAEQSAWAFVEEGKDSTRVEKSHKDETDKPSSETPNDESEGSSTKGKEKTEESESEEENSEFHRPPFRLITILPGCIQGPAVGSEIAESQKLIQICLKGEFPLVPKFLFQYVDVRDVTRAALFLLENENEDGSRDNQTEIGKETEERERYIVVGDKPTHLLWLSDIARFMKLGPFKQYPIKLASMPAIAMKMVPLIDPRVGKELIDGHTRLHPGYSNDKLKSKGFEYKYTIATTIKDTATWLIENGHAPKIANVKSNTKDGDQEPVVRWLDDSETTKCLVCHTEFTLINRRHHCRGCGKIVCGKCGPKGSVPFLPSSYKVRVCEDCSSSFGDVTPDQSDDKKKRKSSNSTRKKKKKKKTEPNNHLQLQILLQKNHFIQIHTTFHLGLYLFLGHCHHL
eukprot:TRINITY_DN2420_c0_g3_i1.p1 TRINITY_DN2420_c0_g3~~TRINITY_DN2420_c0_g3_i1.p1  ORF type:complete len:560 (-),score=96.80 TRINITY_DN2420_c0_g3_i1:254-1933(-)